MVVPLKSTHGTVSDSLPIDGQIAGAHYGVDLLPAEWRERVAMREMFFDTPLPWPSVVASLAELEQRINTAKNSG